MRTLASHQCGPGSNPGVDAVCELSLFSPLLREVFLRVLWFSPLLKNQHFQIPVRPGISQTKNHCVDVLPLNHSLLFTYLGFARVSFVHFQIISEILPLSYFNGIICPIPFPFAKRRDLDRYSVSKTPTWWGDYFLNYPAFFHRSYLLSEPKQEFIASHQNQLLIPRKPLFQIWQQNGG